MQISRLAFSSCHIFRSSFLCQKTLYIYVLILYHGIPDILCIMNHPSPLQADLKTEMESKQAFLNSKLTSELETVKESLADNFNSLTSLEEKTQEKLANLKDEMDSINCAQESRFDDKFENVREALAKTIEKTSEDMNHLDRRFNEETLKMKKDISANQEKIAKEAENVDAKQRNIIERLNTQEENQSKTNDIIKANFDTIKNNFDTNLRETDQKLKEEMENLKTDLNAGIKVRTNFLKLISTLVCKRILEQMWRGRL